MNLPDPEAVAAAWSSNVDPSSGQTYFYNTITQLSSWVDPFPSATPSAEPAANSTAESSSLSSAPADEGADDGVDVEVGRSGTPQRRQSASVKLAKVNWGEDKDELNKGSAQGDSVEGDNPFFQSNQLRTASGVVANANQDPQAELLALPEKTNKGGGGVSFAGIAQAKTIGRDALHQVRTGEVDVADAHSVEDGSAGEESKSTPLDVPLALGSTKRRPTGSKGQPAMLPPPAKTSVPVDALARAGERSLKWQEYVKRHLLSTNHVSAAGIFDLRNCARWTATQDLLPRHYHILDSASGEHHGVNEAASTVFLMKSGALPKHGLRFNGILYNHSISTEAGGGGGDGAGVGVTRWVVCGTKDKPKAGNIVDPHWGWAGGIVLVRTCRAFVVATYDTGKGHDASVCRAAVEGLAAFMTDYAC